MRSGEKYPEQLNESEKDIFGLTAEIIKWSDPVYIRRYPGVTSLREEATRLYGMLSGMDYVNDDRYYKVAAEAERLRATFESLKQMVENEKADAGKGRNLLMNIDFEQGASVESVMENLRKNLKPGEHMRILKNWIPETPSGEGDNIAISISMPPISTGHCERIRVLENFSPYYFKGSSILQGIAETSLGNSLNLSVHKHEERDEYEITGEIDDLPLEKALEVVEQLLQLIKKGRQLKAGKKEEYEQDVEDVYAELEGVERSL